MQTKRKNIGTYDLWSARSHKLLKISLSKCYLKHNKLEYDLSFRNSMAELGHSLAATIVTHDQQYWEIFMLIQEK